MPPIHFASFGDVSTGTLRTEDLLSSFADELAYQLGRQSRRFKRIEYRSMIREAASIIRANDFDTDEASFLVEAMQEALDIFAPPLGYFGTIEGDGASFGYYVQADAIEEYDGRKVKDLSEIEAGYRGEFMLINDHGNVSLYTKNSRREKLIWAIV
jgi:hypothetical protein